MRDITQENIQKVKIVYHGKMKIIFQMKINQIIKNINTHILIMIKSLIIRVIQTNPQIIHTRVIILKMENLLNHIVLVYLLLIQVLGNQHSFLLKTCKNNLMIFGPKISQDLIK